MADPFVLTTRGGYYAYGTGDVSRDGRRFPVLFSRDLANWESVGGALEPSVHLPDDADYWAPAAAERDGQFLLYYSAAPAGEFIRQRLRVATASRPDGPFRDLGYEMLPEDGFSIDAHPFTDPRDGGHYLFFARDYLDGERPGTGLAVARLADDLMTVIGDSRPILRPYADWQIFERERDLYGHRWAAWHTLEGPCVIERGGLYYCFFSGGCWEGAGYRVSYAVSEHPLGPWIPAPTSGSETDRGTLLRTEPEGVLIGPGHNTVATAPDGETQFIVYHAWDSDRTARRMCLDVLHWENGVPRCNGPTHEPRRVPLRD